MRTPWASCPDPMKTKLGSTETIAFARTVSIHGIGSTDFATFPPIFRIKKLNNLGKKVRRT